MSQNTRQKRIFDIVVWTFRDTQSPMDCKKQKIVRGFDFDASRNVRHVWKVNIIQIIFQLVIEEDQRSHLY